MAYFDKVLRQRIPTKTAFGTSSSLALGHSGRGVLRDWGKAAVLERHDKLEAMIGAESWLVGGRPSLADALLVGVARWLDVHGLAGEARWPRLAAVRRRIEADPAVVYAMAVEFGETPPGGGACRGHVPLAEVIARFGV